jgi:SH3 domain
VTVIDKSDPDWWKGKCLGRIGYFPSKYCAKLAGGEKPLQVTHNLQVSDGERGEMTLLRDQIVIQVRIEANEISYRSPSKVFLSNSIRSSKKFSSNAISFQSLELKDSPTRP